MKKRRQAKTTPTITPTITSKGNPEEVPGVEVEAEGGEDGVEGGGDDGKGVTIKYNNKITFYY